MRAPIYEPSVSFSSGPAFISGFSAPFLLQFMAEFAEEVPILRLFLNLNHFLIFYEILSIPPTETAAAVVK